MPLNVDVICMFTTTHCDLYPNLSFASDVSDKMRDIIVDIYHGYFANNPRFQKEILVIPSHEHVFPDRSGLLYFNFGMLFYDPAKETFLMAYAMFAWIEMLGDATWNNVNIYSHSVSFDYVILSALKVAPRECIQTFADIPYFDILSNIQIRDDQIDALRAIGNSTYGHVDYTGNIRFSVEWARDFLLERMKPCKLEHMLGVNTVLKITRNLNNWKERSISKLERHIMTQLVLYGTVSSHFEVNVATWESEPIVFKVTVEYKHNVGTVITMNPTHSRLNYILNDRETRLKNKRLKKTKSKK